VMKMSRGGFRLTAPIGFGVLDVRDYAEGVLRAAERGTNGRRYILSGANVMTDQLLREVAAVAGVEPPGWLFSVRAGMLYPIVAALELWSSIRGTPPKATRSVLELWGRYAWYDTSRARDELGWTPRPLRETLESTIRWAREAGRRVAS
jgi:dihydroflavonol-4-reductase